MENKVLHIEDLSLLRITKVKPWAIYFDYDNKHYLIHGSTDGYESTITLYERLIDEHGYWELVYISSLLSVSGYILQYFINKQKGKTIVYKNIDKEYFVTKLYYFNFATFSDMIEIIVLNTEIKDIEKRIHESKRCRMRLETELIRKIIKRNKKRRECDAARD